MCPFFGYRMIRSGITEKTATVVLFCFTILVAIGYLHLYWRINTECNVATDSGVTTNVLQDKVAVDVYYESLCSDSSSFVIEQLIPAVHLLGDWISLKMIPYGKSQSSSDHGQIKFRCQHGPRECVGNKYHSCIVDKTSSNINVQVRVIGCIFESLFSPMESTVKKCCKKFGLNFKDIKECVTGHEGVDLMKIHAAATEPLRLHFVPTIVLNRVFGGQEYQAKILKNLKAEVCKIVKYNTTNRDIDKVCPYVSYSESDHS